MMLYCSIALTACGGTVEATAPGESDTAMHPDAANQDSGPVENEAGAQFLGTT
jgi:hypothetical protein